jgi:hypothetical protein
MALIERITDIVALFWLLTYLHPATMWTFYAVQALTLTALVVLIRRAL